MSVIPEELLIATLVFIFGSIWGSFSNVVIYRYPLELSVVRPSSHCFNCKKKVPWYLNIPLISWLILSGKCKFCKEKISFRYFVVELLMATLFLLAYKTFGFSFYFFEVLIFIFGIVTASMIDFDHYILPNVFTKGGAIVGLLGAFLNPERGLIDAVLGFVFGYGIFKVASLLYYLVRKEDGLGGGDIKLLGWVGTLLGASAIPFVIIISCLFGSLIGFLLMIKSGDGLKQKIAFGPYISLAALILIFWNHRVFLNLAT